MHKPDPIETILARLMPPALSETSQHEIESMLDELAGETAPARRAKSAGMAWIRRIFTGGIAAAQEIIPVHIEGAAESADVNVRLP